MNILRRLFGAAKRPNPTSQELTPLPTTPPVDQPSPPVITTIEGQEEHDPETLRRSLFAFIQATLPEKRTMLHHTPLLLTPTSDHHVQGEVIYTGHIGDREYSSVTTNVFSVRRYFTPTTTLIVVRNFILPVHDFIVSVRYFILHGQFTSKACNRIYLLQASPMHQKFRVYNFIFWCTTLFSAYNC